jgi:hypothetical protein
MVDAAVVGAAVGRPLTQAEETDVLVLAPPHNPEDAWLLVWEELAPFLLYPTWLGVAGVVAGLVGGVVDDILYRSFTLTNFTPGVQIWGAHCLF